MEPHDAIVMVKKIQMVKWHHLGLLMAFLPLLST